MSLIQNKFIGVGEVVEDAINDAEVLKAPSQNAVFDALALKVNSSLLGANNGVATLDGSGKLPSSQLTIEAFEYKGSYNATTDSPSLSDGSGSTGDVYHVSVAGTNDFGAGNITFAVNDKVVYNGSVWEKWQTSAISAPVDSVNGATGVVVLDSDDIAEGAANFYYTEGRFDTSLSGKDTADLAEGSNLYFTNARAIAAPITGYVSGAGTVAATDTLLEAIQKLNGNIAAVPSASQPSKENFTLIAGDITNQYVDMAQVIVASSLDLHISGVHMVEGVDYSISLTGGAGGKTRLSFLGALATAGAAALIAGDILNVKYWY